MKLKKIPLVLALTLAMSAMVVGCTQGNEDKQSASDADVGAVTDDAHATHVDAHATAHAEHDADHADALAHATGVDFPVPANHEPWTPDAPLMEGMSRVRHAIATLGAQPQPDEATVMARAADVDAAIEYMFANCKLDTEPDIALHAILARLMAGTKALHANPLDTSTVDDMHAAVKNYDRLFDDPNSRGEADS